MRTVLYSKRDKKSVWICAAHEAGGRASEEASGNQARKREGEREGEIKKEVEREKGERAARR